MIKIAEIILSTGAIEIIDYNTLIYKVRNKSLDILYSHLGLNPKGDAEMVRLYENKKAE